MADREWLSTQDAARRLGMTSEWVRRQILEERLVARFYLVGRRRTYRIHISDLRRFEIAYLRLSTDEDRE